MAQRVHSDAGAQIQKTSAVRLDQPAALAFDEAQVCAGCKSAERKGSWMYPLVESPSGAKGTGACQVFMGFRQQMPTAERRGGRGGLTSSDDRHRCHAAALRHCMMKGKHFLSRCVIPSGTLTCVMGSASRAAIESLLSKAGRY
jgi:hypothetical protein